MPVIVKTSAVIRRGHMNASDRKDAQWRFRIYVALIALAAMSPVRSIFAGEVHTAEDAAAEHEIAIATPVVIHMNRVLEAEMKRLLWGTGGPPSPEITRYLDGPSLQRIDIGDVRVALHVRFIEIQRREFVAGIALAKATTAGNCGSPSPGPDQLLDAELRAKVLTAVKCHQNALDQFKSGMHKVNQDYESMLLALNLPPYTQEKMLAQAHASTVRQDAEISADYANRRKILQANADLLTYLDAHAAHAHYVNNQLLFDDPDEAAAMQVLLNRLNAVSQ